MSLVEHAKRELALLDNDDEFNSCIINAVEAFAKYGHSGGSAFAGIHILHDLLQFKNLSPLSDDPEEWMKIDEELTGGKDQWQSRRDPRAFSHDAGQTYYLVSDGAGDEYPWPRYKTEEHKVGE